MKSIKLISLALLMSFSSLQAQIEVITSDISNFWIAFDSVQTTKDAAKQTEFMQTLYLDKATFGLKYAVNSSNANVGNWVEMIEKGKEQLLRIRPLTLSVLSQKPTIDAKIERFKALYPDFKKGNIYFVIGTGIFGGRVSEGHLIIGAEKMASDKADWAVPIVLHEYVHTQQTLANDALLSHSILEGMADFIAELVYQKDFAEVMDYIDFGNKNEEAVWTEFKKYIGSSEKNNTFFDWLYGNKGRVINGTRMNDLGYFMGYKICKSYYAQAADKTKALKEMIEMDFSKEENAKAFLLKSGYVPKKDRKFVENLVFAPVVEKVKKVKKVQYGYAIKGENVVFTFELPKSEDISTVPKVTIAGTFNGWNPSDDKWRMAFLKDRKYEYSLPKSTFDKGKTYMFKFVINGKNWQDAPETALNTDKSGNNNLTFVVE